MFPFFKKKSKDFVDETREEQAKDIEKLYPVELKEKMLAGEECDQISSATGEFGHSATNPIPVNGHWGEIKYIQRLRCACGAILLFHRLRSVEVSLINEPVDIFETVCIDGKHWDLLYLHLYHPRRSTFMPKGYTFSRFDPLYSKACFALGTNKIMEDFPFGMSTELAENLGGTMGDRFVKLYEKYVNDRSKFKRSQDHLKKLEIIAGINNIHSNLAQFESDHIEQSDLNTKNAEAYLKKGNAYSKEKNYDQAILNFTKAIEINSNFELAYKIRGHTFLTQGNLTQAILDFTKVIKMNPKDAEIYFGRSLAYFILRDYEKCWRDVHKAQELGYIVDQEFIDTLKKNSGR